ncbi:5162_t:CDS:2, partial [Racocetra fulgida]
SRDISYYSSPAKTYNTPVNRTSRTSVNPNSQLSPFDPFKPAEYVLSNLGEEKIYAKLLKQKAQNVQSTNPGKRSINKSQSTSVVTNTPTNVATNTQQQSMEIDEADLSVMESQVGDTPQIDGVHSSSVGKSKPIEDDSIIVISDEEDDKPKDGDHSGDKDKL